MIRYAIALLMLVSATVLAGDTVKMQVKGMHCDNCVDKVKSAVQKVKGVEKIDVNLEKGVAEITMASNGRSSSGDVAKAIVDAGYGVTYQDGSETKSLDAVGAAKHVDDCAKNGKMGDNLECPKESKSGCCTKQEMKSKAKSR